MTEAARHEGRLQAVDGQLGTRVGDAEPAVLLGAELAPVLQNLLTSLPSVISPTTLAIVAAAPNSVSRLLGKLDVSRHLTVSPADWAIAGAAAAAALE